MGSNKPIKGKIIERKQCSNPNGRCKPKNLIVIRHPTKFDPYGEKFCTDCRTTQTWGIFIKIQESQVENDLPKIKKPIENLKQNEGPPEIKESIETSKQNEGPPETIEFIEKQEQKILDWYNRIFTLPNPVPKESLK